MKLARLASAALLLGALPLTAQNHPETFILSGSSIQMLTGTGTVTTLINNPGSAHGVAMDVDNKNVLFGVTATNTTVPAIGLFSLDPNTGTYTTVVTDTALSAEVTEVIVDGQGDYIVGGEGATGYGVYRVRGGSVIGTIFTTLASGVTGSVTGGLIQDIDDGDFVLQLFGGSGPHALIKVAADGGAVTSILALPNGPRYDFAQSYATGNYLVGANDSSVGILYEVTKAGGVTTATTLTNRFAFNVPTADRQSAAAPRLIHPYIGDIHYTDMSTFTVTSVAVSGSSVSPRGMTVYQSRNIQPVRTGAGTWTIRYSFPGDAGKGLLSCASLLGVRPGVTLADGRTIRFNFDGLAYVSLAGAAAPYFTGSPTFLDGSGEATGGIDVTSLPTGLDFVIHIIAVVVDGAAPLGVGAIADPVVLRITT